MRYVAKKVTQLPFKGSFLRVMLKEGGTVYVTQCNGIVKWIIIIINDHVDDDEKDQSL